MSQHFVRFHHAPSNCDVIVQLGWDRPLQGFYMFAVKAGADGKADFEQELVYDNLLDVGHPQALTPFKEVAERLCLAIPEVMWRNAYQDMQTNAVSRQYFYAEDGTPKRSLD